MTTQTAINAIRGKARTMTKINTERTELAGKRFGRLVLLERHATPNERRIYLWTAICDCGTVKTVRYAALANGNTKSCGCLKREINATSRPRPPRAIGRTTEFYTYKTWESMKRRCTKKDCHEFPFYGARGISVCEKWTRSFEAFYSDMGRRPKGKTIDRIDVNGNYEPSNCRWATPKEQARNRRNNSYIEARGEARLLCEWSEISGVSESTISTRLKAGWSTELAIFGKRSSGG